MTASCPAPRALALPVLALLMVAALVAVPDAARAQTPVTTIENAGGDVVLESYDDGALLAPYVSAGAGAIPATGSGVRMMWYPDKAAFRAGEVTGNEWDDSNVGYQSMAFGRNTTASGFESTAMGLGTTASNNASTAMGRGTTASGIQSTAMGYQTEASGGSSTAMGEGTTASGQQSTAMGYQTEASGGSSTAMGWKTTASGGSSTAMGSNTTASGESSTAMGLETTASDPASTAMGANTTASGPQSTAMGFETTAGGDQSTTMGARTTAGGIRSMAAGYRAEAEASGSFVWNDGNGYHAIPNSSNDGLSSSKTVSSSSSEPTGANTFSVGATGGVRFITGSGNLTYIESNGTGWSNTSTRSAKTDVTRADPTAVLEAVEAMPISTWEYKTESGQGAGTRHIGPMAEDFHGALPYDLGSSAEHINSLNADGVALGAVKGLARKVERQKETIAALKAESKEKIAALKAENRDQQSTIDEQNERIDRLEKRLAALEAEASAAPATAGLMGSSAGSWGLVLLLGLGGLAAGLLWRRR